MINLEGSHFDHRRNQSLFLAGIADLGARSHLRVGSAVVVDQHPKFFRYFEFEPYKFERRVVTLEIPPTYTCVGQAYIYYRLGDTGFYPEIRLVCYKGSIDTFRAPAVISGAFNQQRVSVRIHEVNRGQRLAFPYDPPPKLPRRHGR